MNKILFTQSDDAFFFTAATSIRELVEQLVDLLADSVKEKMEEREERFGEKLRTKKERMAFIEDYVNPLVGPIYIMTQPDWMNDEEFANIDPFKGPAVPEEMIEDLGDAEEIISSTYERYCYPHKLEGLCEAFYKAIFG